MTKTLNVEHAELIARADELDAPIPGVPANNGHAPCALELATRAAQQLAFSADNMRIYLAAGEREHARLAQSLRNAAKAYEDLDELAADALDNDTPVAAAAPAHAEPDDAEPAMLASTVSLRGLDPIPYYPVKEAAKALMQGDQGRSLLDFADEWAAYLRTLSQASFRFRPFTDWDSEASDAVERHFDLDRNWLDHMARLCGQLSTQARNLVAAHRWAVSEHPTLEKLRQVDERWISNQSVPGWERVGKPALLRVYAQYQAKSEAVLAEYEQRVELGPVNPPRPPVACKIDVPSAPDLRPGPGLEPLPLPDGGLPPFGGAMPVLPSGGMPSMPTDATRKDAPTNLKAAPGLPKGASVKPASAGAGGAGLPAMPKMPLQLAQDSSAVSRLGATAGGGVPIPAAYAALNKGGGMGMPMGAAPAGHGQDGVKAKRVQHGDESIYTEDRAWTEGVIGRRRAS
ncbi:MAG: secretion protein EspB [Actinomycetota bacterium]|uniref:Secretion protein EspB n=1 Tax=Mycobacterium lentiflavum TaxID=141349 RepID=A0ABY3UXH6_MYCLN|nr:secretion protein EspB [Mycobacterium lentiflavum]MEE3066137.1 secretion protein EspB [Actinomycetota bacterium]ULP44290.1 secretion protein EspB [Mycobacterium lentiflavum]